MTNTQTPTTKYEKFARLFEMPDGNQILFTMDYDSDEEKHWMYFRSEFNGIMLRLGAGGNDEASLRKVFDKLTQNKAETYYKQLKRNVAAMRTTKDEA